MGQSPVMLWSGHWNVAGGATHNFTQLTRSNHSGFVKYDRHGVNVNDVTDHGLMRCVRNEAESCINLEWSTQGWQLWLVALVALRSLPCAAQGKTGMHYGQVASGRLPLVLSEQEALETARQPLLQHKLHDDAAEASRPDETGPGYPQSVTYRLCAISAWGDRAWEYWSELEGLGWRGSRFWPLPPRVTKQRHWMPGPANGTHGD